MAKEITDKKDKKERKEKKDKKEKKEKRSEVDGVKKHKKEKKDKKANGEGPEVSEALEVALTKASSPPVAAVDHNGDVVMEGAVDTVRDVPIGALVPFAFPLAEDGKELKRIMRCVKKSAKNKTLKRGVKEVVKALRKSEGSNKPSSSGSSNPPAVVVIAADISPMDVISHLPVLCEDHNIPYIYVKSRAELGEASSTKRPTSVVMIGKDKSSKKAEKEKVDKEEQKEFEEAYSNLVSVVVKAAATLKK